MREAVPDDAAILAIDLADAEQACGVFAPDQRLLARKGFRCGPWDLGTAIDWAQRIARKAGHRQLVVACEPTGHRWKVVFELCRRRALTLVCVQPMLVHREREREDYTKDRSDPKDVLLIAHLTRERRCYLPEVLDENWARLRHLGRRRDGKLEQQTAARQQLRDLLDCYWPTVLKVARKPLDSMTFIACLLVCCDPSVIAAMPYEQFAAAVSATCAQVGATRRNHRILKGFWDAAHHPQRLPGEQRGAAERASFALEDLLAAQADVAEVEQRMIQQLTELGLLKLATSIDGLSAVGAAAILAESGDPRRYDISRCMPKLAGVCPRDNTSGRFKGQTTVSRRGRPLLRTAAWRAIWGLLPHNTVFADRYRHLTTRTHNPLNDGQARAALCAALLRQLWAVITTGQAWDPQIARHGQPQEVTPAA